MFLFCIALYFPPVRGARLSALIGVSRPLYRLFLLIDTTLITSVMSSCSVLGDGGGARRLREAMVRRKLPRLAGQSPRLIINFMHC